MDNLYRVLDANLNRAVEGIRVIEDLVRFGSNNREISSRLRELRQQLRESFRPYQTMLLGSRESRGDVGQKTSSESTVDKRKSPRDIIDANFRRAQEAIRSIEESAKALNHYSEAKKSETIRFELYTLHQTVLTLFKHSLPDGIYGITDEKFSNGRDVLSQTREMCEAGIKIIQFREKKKCKREKLLIAKEMRKITSKQGVKLIINDDIDIALSVNADGIHIGQDDIDPIEARKIVGPNMMIGLSTHNEKQLLQACELPVDYIGVGPIFSTQTKENVCDAVGLEYLEIAVQKATLGFVAIGGIKEGNIDSVLELGAKSVCLVSEIVGAENIGEIVTRLKNRFDFYQTKI